jgi:hypothetical protein
VSPGGSEQLLGPSGCPLIDKCYSPKSKAHGEGGGGGGGGGGDLCLLAVANRSNGNTRRSFLSVAGESLVYMCANLSTSMVMRSSWAGDALDPPLWTNYVARVSGSDMMMSFICSYRKKQNKSNAIHPLGTSLWGERKHM